MSKLNNLSYVVIDDVFEDPDKILEIAKKYTFYSSNEPNPMNARGEQWKGYRSDLILMQHKGKCCQPIIEKILDSYFNTSMSQVELSISDRFMFHYIPKEFALKKGETWEHIDGSDLFAGVLYLDKNPKKNTGTILFDGDKKVKVENKYNRLVFYRSDIMHTPDKASAYGTDLSDSRLTLVFFIDMISIKASVAQR